MYEPKKLTLVEWLLLVVMFITVGVAGFTIWNNRTNSLPPGVALVKEQCFDQEIGPAIDCMPAHYDNLVDIEYIRNEDQSVKEVRINDELISGEEYYTSRQKMNAKISKLKLEKCQEIGGFYEDVYVGGLVGFNIMCLVKSQ